MTYTSEQILTAVQTAFASASAQNPVQKVASFSVADNCTLRVTPYNGPRGSGFEVVATVLFGPALGWKVVCCLQSGPENSRQSNHTLPSLLLALLEAEFKGLSAGMQAFLEPIRQAVVSAMEAENIVRARAIIASCPAPTADLLAEQAAMLAFFPASSAPAASDTVPVS